MAYQPVSVVGVRAWGDEVGAVAIDPASGIGIFEYTPEWVRGGRELSPFEAPLSARVVRGPTHSRDTFLGLPPFLADSLPDAFGNAVVDAYLVREGIDRTMFTPLDRLVYAGSRALGALEYYPAGPVDATPSALDLTVLVTEARRAIRGDLTRASTTAVQQLLAVGTSAGGARAKGVIAISDTNEVRSGSLPPEPGWRDYVIKFDGTSNDDGHSDGYTRVEYAYHLMARAAGIHVANAQLLEEGGRAHYLSERFDRAGGERWHMQTLCAMRGLDFNLTGTHDYGQYLDTVTRLNLGGEALHEAFRRAVFNVRAYNRDDHTKNVSFLMDKHGTWSLAPAYDLTFSYRPDSPWVARHQMSIDGVFDNPTDEDLRRLGDRWGVPGINEALSAVHEAVDAWDEFAAEASVGQERREAIGALISR